MFTRRRVYSDLRLDRPCIFLPATRPGEASTTVTGKLSLYLPQNVSIQKIHVKLKGILKIPCQEYFSKSFQGALTFEQTQVLATSKKSGSFQLSAGKYEFPFEFCLERGMGESLMGPGHQYHAYEVCGVITRQFGGDSVITTPLQIYYTPSQFMDDLWGLSPVSIDNYWEGRVHYNISIPNRDIPFGSIFPVNLWFVPLSKSITLKTITIEVEEQHILRITPSAADSIRYNSAFFRAKRNHIIFREVYGVEDYVTTESDISDVEWSTTKSVHLPQDLKACTQRVDLDEIKVSHSLKIIIEMQDTDGRIPKIIGCIPFNIYMSPQNILENGDVYQRDLREPQDDKTMTPPLYGDHLGDCRIPDHSSDPQTVFMIAQ
ncbi:hypothetical protein N7462_000379 [Penicillium macrosclerotiorum]|uniref:uncharacterized protein n=1 Tax=Penicillium macrosclerotiorum TaxID=303699 RepID=UPI002548ACCB|nr:uncharacterized protein N7462_000379 [Penicillium macrosclerotiorum]KAJ5698374.1 hypothetical protein N7462_000379 [Penicillium macrosclerotiorum]